MRYTPDGKTVTTLSLATDRPGAKDTTSPDWHRVVLYGRLAEVANQYLAKGRLVFVAGRLTYRRWKDDKGQQRQVAEVVASDLVLLDRRPEAPPAEEAGAQADGDELPF